jgi:large subunit ribosomal protein L21
MEAVIRVKGFQIPVKRGQKVILPNLNLKGGETFSAEVIMKKLEDGKVSFEKGTAILRVLGEKEEKLIVFKMRSKKNYRRMYFHTQKYTVAKVEEIV